MPKNEERVMRESSLNSNPITQDLMKKLKINSEQIMQVTSPRTAED